MPLPDGPQDVPHDRLQEVRKRSLTIAGHRTSISLEPVFWDALKDAADERGQSLAGLVAEIDEARATSLSSAIRVWLFERARQGR
ncbi:aryl-sulfate sulfotransferase [Pacificimonas flava]|uniref:Aryl-sulfate sulfotransferase n=2 Tax=Pacificimonas TaxID=1960290 RepID=A0A219B121_9SPHN|nr:MULTISPECIES: ribbon-helix-helix domain-containing protein [Pacificimonas]MBZ6380058.1 ribbon-helix-helix domain-containing protein [Pacificimonas aurantium]OWV32027.1 aryl-sulfate sulfotransferase [Pacificimonas flava]